MDLFISHLQKAKFQTLKHKGKGTAQKKHTRKTSVGP